MPLTHDEILKKHKPLTEEQLREYKEKVEEKKAKYTLEMSQIEANLLQFLERPRVVYDSETKKPILYLRDITFNELKQMIPPEMAEYVNKPEMIDKEKAEEYDRKFYEIIADLIVKPKHDAEWWRLHMTTKLMRIIQEEIVRMLEDIGVEMENFRKAPKGK